MIRAVYARITVVGTTFVRHDSHQRRTDMGWPSRCLRRCKLNGGPTGIGAALAIIPIVGRPEAGLKPQLA